MKKYLRLLMVAVLALGVSVSAEAQLKGVLNKAKKAVKEKTEKAVDKAVDQALGDDSQSTSTTKTNTNTNTNTSKPAKTQSTASKEEAAPKAKAIPSGPEIPQLMAMPEAYNDYDETGRYINSLAWGLRKTSEADAKALAAKLTERMKFDMKTLEELEEGENWELQQQLIKEIKNWQYFYVKMGEIMNLINFAQMKKDSQSGAYYYEGSPMMNCGMHVAGNTASEEGVMGRGALLFTRKNGKAYFCDAKLQPIFAEDDDIRVAKLDLNMVTNIFNMFDGYPLEWCQATQQGSMKDQFDVYFHKASTYITNLREAIKGNSLSNLEFKPMPKAGSLNASMKAKALAAERQKAKDVVDVVIVSNSWEIQKNAAGQPIRRVIYGYSVGNTKHGKMATRVSWAEDYQGGGKYGSLHPYGVGMDSFYVK
jgi:hypothetical protein